MGSDQTQSWDPSGYERHARFVSDLGRPVVDLLAPRAGERILDLGCGDGALTKVIAGFDVEVIGVDASPEQVAAARMRGLDARQMDGENLEFEQEFDAVFSNAALHWMMNTDAVIAGVARALRPGRRFVGEFGGGHGNVAACMVALIAALRQRGIDARAAIPWYFPTVEEYREKLETQGFRVDRMELISRPTPLPTSIEGWLETFAGRFFSLVPDAAQRPLRDEVVELLRPCLCDSRGRWTADYVRLRFAAHLV